MISSIWSALLPALSVMNKNNDRKNLFPNDVSLSKGSIKESLDLPWLFKHTDLIKKMELARPIKRDRLVNVFNYLNFIEGHVFIHFNHLKYEEGILLKAYPEPCTDFELECRWQDRSISRLIRNNYVFQQVIIASEKSIILIPADLKAISSKTILVELPEKGFDICQRRVKRYPCSGVRAEISRNGALFHGDVLDFSPISFRVNLMKGAMRSIGGLNGDSLSAVNIWKQHEIIFSGNCECIRSIKDDRGGQIIFTPFLYDISQHGKKRFRNPRRLVSPPPLVHFSHPFFDRPIKRQVYDLSNTGFSIYETMRDQILMPGMILPEVSIKYVSAVDMKCKAQVIYCKEEDDRVRSGLVILDMDVNDFSHLSQIVNQASNHYTFISDKVDMNALWEFFFETGFIYPHKYHQIQSYRDSFKETYRKLYEEHPNIARHFTYEEEGKIYGHMSMIRAYEKTWLIQHHAARTMENKFPGLEVLRTTMVFLNGMHQLPSTKVDYGMCYYRPENKFPDRAFGNFARDLGNPQLCSLDLFTYLNLEVTCGDHDLPEGWSLQSSEPIELWELEHFYRFQSGGLFMNVLDFSHPKDKKDSLEIEFRNLGFTRKWRPFSLSYKDRLCAVLLVNQSDIAINLSELLNGITVFVVKKDILTWKILTDAVSKLATIYNLKKIPLLVYPNDFDQFRKIADAKKYHLWIGDMRYISLFIDYMQSKFKMNFT
jgi:hypothetical protein